MFKFVVQFVELLKSCVLEKSFKTMHNSVKCCSLYFSYDQSAAIGSFRRCLEIRETHLDKDSTLIADALFELGMHACLAMFVIFGA